MHGVTLFTARVVYVDPSPTPSKITAWSLIDIDMGGMYSLESFKSKQSLRRQQVTTELKNFVDAVVGIVRDACDQVVDKFLRKNKMKADHKMSFMQRAAMRVSYGRFSLCLEALNA